MTDGSQNIHALLTRLASGQTLSDQAAESAFRSLLSGAFDEAQTGALLALLAARQPSAQELTGAARAMRASVTPVPYTPEPDESLIDTCGTGGAPKTFNVSTAAAIIAASVEPPAGSGISRVVVAKHGNRSRTGRGSAEVLAALGVDVDASHDTQARCLREAGVCFCFAIHHHPAMRHAAGPRRSLGFPTIFNLLGPLTNPANAPRQMIGVYRPEFVTLVAETLAALGATRAIVAHSHDGLDELTITAPTSLAHVDPDGVRTETFDPSTLGLASASIDDLRADGVERAADVIQGVLHGTETGPKRDMALLSAAGACLVAGVCADLAEGLSLAREAVDSGRARETLATLARVSREGV